MKVTTGCRDCRKCTNSIVSNFGRNSGRVLAGVYTAGLSELGMSMKRKCRICGHQMSLHQGSGAATPQPAVEVRHEPDDVVSTPSPRPAQRRAKKAASSAAPPAGWLMDPEGSGHLRWWNGTGWTEHLQPAPAATGAARSQAPTKARARSSKARKPVTENPTQAKNRADARAYDFADDNPRDGSAFSKDVASIQTAFRDGVISQRKYRERLKALREFHGQTE
jgi:hypothetical protein